MRDDARAHAVVEDHAPVFDAVFEVDIRRVSAERRHHIRQRQVMRRHQPDGACGGERLDRCDESPAVHQFAHIDTL